MFTNTHPAFCWKNVRCKVKGGLEQQRARFYRGARFRILLILSHRNLVRECLPQTLLYAAWRLRQPRPATELCKLYRRARFWKSPELKPAPTASTEKFFGDFALLPLLAAYTMRGNTPQAQWKNLSGILNKRQIFVRWKVERKIFLKLHPLNRKKFVRCKVKGQNIGTKPSADSLS